MKIATWNVNSVRMRLPLLLEWLKEQQPDVVLLQETKCMNDVFPRQEIEDLGYNIAVYGQKTFNGVAILAKSPIEDVTTGVPNIIDEEGSQTRYIEAVVGKVRVVSVYVPNGQEVGCDKFLYKMEFLKQLHSHLESLLNYEEICVIGGDFNIAPTDRDVAKPENWVGDVLCSPEERQWYRAFLNLGYQDAIRLHHHDEKGPYTWWDYRSGAFEKGGGLRIDHLLLSPQATDIAVSSGVDRELRAKEKASDHAPVWCTLNTI